MGTLIALLFLGFFIWVTCFQSAYYTRKEQKRHQAILDKNNLDLKKFKDSKRNRAIALEKIIFEQFLKSKNTYAPHGLNFMFNLPYNFDSNVTEYLDLIRNKYIEPNNKPEFLEILSDHHKRMEAEKIKREKVLKEKAIKDKEDVELKCKAKEKRIIEEESRQTEKRYKNVTSEKLESEAIAWYELQEEIRRGK